MKILTRRNAMLGWATWKAAKGIAKYQKAKKSIPTPAKKTSKKKKAGKVLAGAAAAAGVTALLKRKRKHGGGDRAPGSSSE
jgi:hypothetical protein